MQGIYKTKLSEEQLGRVVRAAFGCGLRGSSELKDGWANSAYALELDDGRKAVLKARPSADVRLMRCEVDVMKAEVEAMKHFERTEDLPIPRVYVYDPSKQLLPVDYFIMEHMEGTPLNRVKPELDDRQREAIYRRLGEMNRRINEVVGTGFGFVADPHSTTWRDAFAEMIYGALADGRDAGVDLPVPYAELERRIEERLDVMKEVSEPRLLHWDIWDGNVFVKDGAVSAIIDFERAIWGDPVMENYFGRFYRELRAFREGYGMEVNDPSRIARRKLYDLYLDLLLYIECAYRQYDNQDHVRWTRDNLVQGLASFDETGSI